MKMLSLVSICLLTLNAFGAEKPCTAPESVKQVSELLNKFFGKSEIVCDDGNKFSSDEQYECVGDKYASQASPTTTKDGKDVFIVTELAEVKGEVVATEVTFASKQDALDGKGASRTPGSKFKQLTGKALMLYSVAEPTKGSWISTTWFTNSDGKVAGVKVRENKAAFCQSK